MGGGEHGFAERDQRAARNFAQAAAGANVSRIVYLGGLGTDSAELSHHLASRHETGAELARHGVPVTEFRAAVIIGSGSASFEILRHLTERLPIMITPRWVGTRCQPIAIGDVLDYLAAALDHPEVAGIVEIGGPDVLSYADMMRTYARLRGLRRLMIPVPVLTPRLSSYWVNLVSPVPAGIARPLIEGLRNEVVVRDPGPAAAFRLRPLPYVEALRRAIERNDRHDVEFHLVRRPGCTRSGNPLLGDVAGGDDHRAPAAGAYQRHPRRCSPRSNAWAVMPAGPTPTCCGGSAASWIEQSAASACASAVGIPTTSASETRSTSGGWRRFAGRTSCVCGRT